MTDESKIPRFLYIPIPSRADKLKTVEDLRRLILWERFYPDEPYDDARATALQRRLWAETEVRMRKEAEKRAKKLAEIEKEDKELHTRIAELVLGVELLGDPDEVAVGEVGYNTQIRDKVTGKTFGTPRSLFKSRNMDWRMNTHPCDDLDGYLRELTDRFDDWSYQFSFPRGKLNVDVSPVRYEFRSYPLERKPSVYCTFRLRLFKQDIGIRRRKKLLKLVEKARKRRLLNRKIGELGQCLRR